MMKTYIAALLVVLMAGTQVVQAQESLDDVFAQLDSAEGTGSTEAVAEPAPAGTADAAPAAVETAGEEAAPVAAPAAMADEQTLYDRGRAYYAAGDYDQAEKVFEAMLKLDPYDTRAMNYLQRTAGKKDALESKKLVPTRKQAMAAIAESWNQEPKIAIKLEEDEGPKEDDPETIAIEEMTARVQSIMIPSLDFRDASVKDVVLFLSETCRRLDPDGKGVNMLLLGVDGSFDIEGNSVTISIRDMSLYDALKYIAEMAKLKFEVRPKAVAIMPLNYAPVTAMEVATYTVSSDVGSDLESAGGGDDGGGGSDDLFGDSFSAEPASGPVDVAAYFTMVKFPDGSSATYHPSFKKLIVKNTPENLKELKQIVDDMEDAAALRRSQQVEIEAKFVEFNDGALEELGFDWTMFGSGSVGGFEIPDGDTDIFFKPDSGWTDVSPMAPLTLDNQGNITGGQPLYTDPASGVTQIQPNDGRPGENVFGTSFRNNGISFEEVTTGVLASMGGTPAAMVFGNGDVDLRLTAMEQEGTADVLSAPRVTTKSGSEAIIRVAEVHRYPQDWDVETGQRTAPVVKPQDWEDFDLGVTLKVTPVVNTESNSIDLELQPEITKFRGFDRYVVAYNAYLGSGGEIIGIPGQSDIVGDGSQLFAQMPYFEKRIVQTQVTIADGHTVVMGGLVDERTETFRDQVPLLGDIPYLGRLFRTEGSRTAKKNLVIYVTATQVDERGMTQADRDLSRVTVAD